MYTTKCKLIFFLYEYELHFFCKQHDTFILQVSM